MTEEEVKVLVYSKRHEGPMPFWVRDQKDGEPFVVGVNAFTSSSTPYVVHFGNEVDYSMTEYEFIAPVVFNSPA